MQTTALSAMSINRYLYISLYFFVFPLQGFFGFGRTWTRLDQNDPRALFALAQILQDRIS